MSAINALSFAALLERAASDDLARIELHRQRIRLVVPTAITGALLLLWSMTAPLSGAIVASGQLKAELNRKTVQHQEGGIVRQILVRDGQLVRAGQPLVVIGDVRNDAELSLLQMQFAAERLRNQRATAEASLAATFAAAAAGGTEEQLAQERALFAARRRTLDETIAALQSQIRDARAQSVAIEAQLDATQQSAQLSNQELAINQQLVDGGYLQRARVLQLQRVAADYKGRLAEQMSSLAASRQRVGDLAARIAQARNQYQQQASDEAQAAATKIREIEERLRPSRDQVERQYVRAPVDGRVMALRVSAVAEVVAPRAAILDLVPTREKLIIEARIRPQDINHVREAQAAKVRLSAFDARTTPLLPGKVAFVSPDRITAPDGREAWFLATVEVDAAALQGHPEVRLQAGMPAELFFTTPQRTLFQYLAKPLNSFASRAMREP